MKFKDKIKIIFKDKETFINYAQIIPGIFIIIWIVMSFYISDVAPKHPDETNDRVYPVNIRGGTAYLTLTEEILICGSAVLGPVSILTLILISNYCWKDEEE